MGARLKRWMIAVAVLVAPTLAGARSVRDEPYPLENTWNAAVRLVRVDMGCTITERDRELGYFTFEYREGSRTVPGSVEIVRTEVDGRQGTRIIVQVPLMPTYVESMLLSRLTRKLHEEYGEPVAPPPRRPAEEPRRPGEDSARPGESRPGESRPGEARPGESRPGDAPGNSPAIGERGSR